MTREGFEAALVVAIVFSYLRRIGRLDRGPAVWRGVALAVALSFAIGIGVHLTIGSLQGTARLRAFAAVSVLALAVLTWMVFWMQRNARGISTELTHQVDRALASDNASRGLALVALLAVLREGIEAALFLIAAATDSSGFDVLTGGFVGLAIALALGLVVYKGSSRIPLKAFFRVSGVVLILFAAGLASKAILDLQMTGDLGSWNLNGVYDLTGTAWLTQSTEVGRFLSALFGWDPRPSIEQVIVYLAYLVPVLYLFLRPDPAVQPARAATPEHSAA